MLRKGTCALFGLNYILNVGRYFFLSGSFVGLWFSLLNSDPKNSYTPTVLVFLGMLIVDYIGKVKLLKFDKNKKFIPALIQILLTLNVFLFFLLLLPLLSGGYIQIHGEGSGVYFFIESGSIPIFDVSGGVKVQLKHFLELLLYMTVLSEIVFAASPSVTPEEIEEFKEKLMEKKRAEKLIKSEKD